MAIQKINLGTEPLGEGGDTYRSANTKINENFNNAAHAASRLVGTAGTQLPSVADLNEAVFKEEMIGAAGHSYRDYNNLPAGIRLMAADGAANGPVSEFSNVYWVVQTMSGQKFNKNGQRQFALDVGGAQIATRAYANDSWQPWLPISTSKYTYRSTTATAANVTVDGDGVLRRASSSLKYKDVISKLELDSDLYNKAMQAKPIVYRSKSEVDPKEWHYMSFIAEELGEIDPSLTQWLVKTHDDEGNELDEPIKEAEGINLNAICAVLHATNIYQDKKLKELEQRLRDLESALPKETK